MCIKEERELKGGEGRRQKKVYGRGSVKLECSCVATSHSSHRKMLQGLELDQLTSSLVSTDHLFQRKPCLCLCLKLPV